MKKLSAVLAMIGVCLSAHGVPTVELKEYAPLKPLHWCQDSEGKVKSQIEECGPGLTEVSSISTIDENGKVAHEKLGTTLDTPANPVTGVTSSPTPSPANERNSDKEVLRQGQKSWLKLLGFAFAFGLIAKLMQRSFLGWFFVGALVHIVLVAANVLSF